MLILPPIQAISAGPATSVFLDAKPDYLPADGKSIATISAEIRDSSGNLVPDGTMVSFSTSLGTIQNTVTTTAGVARARLTSGTVPGTATVSAWVTQGGAAGTIEVELLEPGMEVPRQSFITIASDDYLVYEPSQMIVYADGNVSVAHRGLLIKADQVQFDLQRDEIICRRRTSGDPIVMERGDKKLEASLLYYVTHDMKGKAIVEGQSGSMERISVRGADLVMEPDQEATPESFFDFTDLTESPILIKASSITIKPGDEIQFRHARIYVDGKKVLSVPLHVMALDSSTADASRYIGWGTNGLRIDLPFYYSLSPSSTGSLHLRRGQQAGWGFYSSNSGWSLDLMQQYTTTGGAEGTFALNRLSKNDWGAHWQHSQEFDSGSRIYSYLEFPAHTDLFGTMSYSKPLNKGSLGINVYGSKYKGQSADVTTDVYLQSAPKPIASGAASYLLMGRASYISSGITDSGLGTGLQMQIFGRPVSLGKSTNLLGSVSFGHDWGSARSGLTLLANTSLNHRLGENGKLGNLGLVYSYTRDPGYLGLYGRHRLSANFIYNPSPKWRLHAFSTRTLDASMSSTFADISYQFKPGWRLNLLQTIQKFSTYDYSDTEIAIGKEIHDHELMLVWSKSRNKLRLEVSAARF